MEQPKPKLKETEEKIPKSETIDVGVEFITEGEKMRMSEEKERELNARESFKLSAEAEKYSADVLKENSDEIFRDLAEEYYNENEDPIKQETKIYSKDISREAKYDIVRNLGVFEQLKNKKGNWTEENFEKFALAEGYDELRAQLKSGKVRTETPALILNSLEARKRDIEGKINKTNTIDGKPEYVLKGAERDGLFKKYNEIFSTQIGLAEKIYGKSFIGDKEKKLLSKFNYAGQPLVDSKTALAEKKQEALKEVKEKVFGDDWKNLSDAEKTKHNNNFDSFVKSNMEKHLNKTAKKYGIDEGAVLALMNAGYSLEKFKACHKSFRMGKKVYVENSGIGVSEKKFKKFVKDTKEKFEEEIEQNSYKKISAENESARNLLVGLREKVSKLAFEPMSAQEQMAEAFASLREKIINEGIEKNFKKEEKTREQLERIANKFEGGKATADDFLKRLINRKGKLSELTDGDFDENFDHIKGFMSDFEIPADSFETMDVGKKAKFKERYKRAAKSKTGFVKFMLDLAESFLSPNK